MKKTILIIASILMLYATNLEGQITLEHSYFVPDGKDLYITDLGNNNYKYFYIDYYNDKFSLYNLDHSPFMLNIITGVSMESGLYTIAYITTNLFDCDSTTIEYAMTTVSGGRPFYVFRTDGTQLFRKDSTAGPYGFGAKYGGSIIIQPIYSTPAGTKLMLMNVWTNIWNVYSLCGTLPESISEVEQGYNYVQIYPNPTTGKITFQIETPSNIENYELTIYNASWQKIKTENCIGVKTLTIDNNNLSSGNYFYSLQTKNKILQTGKFIIAK